MISRAYKKQNPLLTFFTKGVLHCYTIDKFINHTSRHQITNHLNTAQGKILFTS